MAARLYIPYFYQNETNIRDIEFLSIMNQACHFINNGDFLKALNIIDNMKNDKETKITNTALSVQSHFCSQMLGIEKSIKHERYFRNLFFSLNGIYKFIYYNNILCSGSHFKKPLVKSFLTSRLLSFDKIPTPILKINLFNVFLSMKNKKEATKIQEIYRSKFGPDYFLNMMKFYLNPKTFDTSKFLDSNELIPLATYFQLSDKSFIFYYRWITFRPAY